MPAGGDHIGVDQEPAPGVGPSRTISSAEPLGSAATAASCSAVSDSVSRSSTTAGMVLVVSPDGARSPGSLREVAGVSGAPH